MAEFDLYKLIGGDWLPKAEKYPAAVHGLSPESAAVAAYCTLRRDGKKGVFVLDGSYDQNKISALFSALFGREPLILPDRELELDGDSGRVASAERALAAFLDRLASGDYDVVLTSPDALCLPLPAPRTGPSSLVLKTGDSADIGELCDFLSSAGYSMFDLVEGEGSFSRRGDILDVFVTGSGKPVRIEFFGDEIERISTFDVISQRREENLDSVKIFGAGGVAPLSPDELISALEAERERTGSRDIENDIDLLKSGVRLPADKYVPLIYTRIYTLFDHIPDADVFVCEPQNMKKRFEFIDWQFEQNVKHLVTHGKYVCDGKYYLSCDEIFDRLGSNSYFYSRLQLSRSVKLSALCSAELNESVVPAFDGDEATDEMLSRIADGYTCVITVRDKDRAMAVRNMLMDREAPVNTAGIKQKAVNVVVSAVNVGICFERQKVLLVADSVVRRKSAPKRQRADGERIRSFDDITPGDLVVHRTHGIGVYRGIRQMTVDGVTKDYITIGFDKGDMLYVPCPQLDLISKYVGGDPARVKLSRMGTSAWEKAKSRVRDESRELARELIELYARRLNTEGYAFSPDTDWQREFEERFEYEETEDQLECTREVKADMERPYPMDRLLCGDVGVGKTEVAMRAAFKAVSDSKQVAILVPTTILANQHYNTVLSRFHGFPIRAEVLSRFRTKKEQEATVAALKRGEVDIIIGTHRLLQKDVKFKDLGLLIVDEEQRFGVRHKEKIKELALGVDVLTMSATPIPRTLNMAMSGIRDISIIEEAPADRLPVMTYVLEYDFDIVEQAILREMRRNGCTFYLKNDIEALDSVAVRLNNAIPDARLMIVHGQMPASEIENAWEKVMAHEVDVLLCTTIIETGIDVSFANTLIIEDADRMGLAQLHQIRGRIGRSSRRAYAYLTYKRDKVPSEVAAKRLTTIREFTEFGAGLKIAMRDLEIRGAGSLLGEKQHGSMNVVGYDTYMEILKNVILTEQGKPVETKADCTVDVSISAYIPESYITSERTRIDVYKKIASVESERDFADLNDELADRFGKPPVSVTNLMRISLVRNMARNLGVTDIKQKSRNIVFIFSSVTDDAVQKLIRRYGSDVMYSPTDKPYITFRMKEGTPVIDRMEEFLKALEE